MIKFRFSTIESSDRDREISIVPSEKLDEAVRRSLEGIELDGREAKEVFQVLVNGHRIDPDMWTFVELKETDSVLICPLLKGGDTGTIFKQVAIIAITAIASVLLTPAGGATIGSALAVGAVTIGATLLLNAMIPPPVPPGGNLGELGGSSFEGSQMYSIAGQSNQAKKFSSVPKVYGTHRIFPNLAANPYVELQADPDSGENVQYLYALYDFGFGPMQVRNLKIGDTPIEEFSDVSYQLVDFNKPAVSEGSWDDVLANDLVYYKGDPEVSNLAITLTGNQVNGDPIGTYQVIQNSAANPDGSPQEITLTFINQKGLYAYSATGDISTRQINLDIFFAPVGTDDWKGFNDMNEVETFTNVGGDNTYSLQGMSLLPCPILGGAPYTLLYKSDPVFRYAIFVRYVTDKFYGYPRGATSIVLAADANLVPGRIITYGDRFLGIIKTVTTYGPDTGYRVVEFVNPIDRELRLFHYVVDEYNPSSDLSPFFGGADIQTGGKIYIGSPTVGKAIIVRAETNAVYSTFKWTPKAPGQYKIRVTRTSTTSAYTSTVQDELTLASITTRFDRSPINTVQRHVFLELKIRATNQLNGVIQNLSGVCSSVLPVLDGTIWSLEETANPAWVFADLLTGKVNKRAIDRSRLDGSSLQEWAAFCDEIPTPPPGMDYNFPRFQSNFVLDYQTTLAGVLQQVSSAAQASLNIVDGKYGVLIDKQKTVPVQVFTTRNSKGFQSGRLYARRPDAVKIAFVDPAKDWDTNQVVVYDDGFDENTAVEIDDLTSFGVTNNEQAWRFGRYMIAQNRLRQETMTLQVDFEYLVCTRGDYVQIAMDVMKVGGVPARVSSVVGNRITIDDAIATLPTYAYVFRSSSTGEISTDTMTPVSDDTFDLDGDIPAVGDIIIVGEADKVVYDCIVKSIIPSDDLTATLTLVEKADGIYEVESTSTFPEYDPGLSGTTDSFNIPPGEVVDLLVVDSGYECDGEGYAYFVDLDWDVPSGSVYEIFEIYVNSGQGFDLVATTKQSFYHYIVDQTRLGKIHSFKVLAVSASGKKLDLGAVSSVTSTPTKKSTPPSDVEKLSTNITNEVLQLDWPLILDCDAREYLIRYSPSPFDLWEASIPLARVSRATNATSVQARAGIYWIKAIDYNGNESENAVAAITTIPNLFNLNIVEETNDFPDLMGNFDRTQKEGDTLVLQSQIIGGVATNTYYPEGYYYYENLLDLGEIFTVRLQSLIQAEGYTLADVMSNWTTLDTVLSLTSVGFSEWDVEAQYRATNDINVMSQWTTLASIDPINVGLEDNYTEWRKFIMGDATGRIFQFRLKLISNKPSVSPRVIDGTIRADMPDRREEYQNLVASAMDGYTLAYDPPFFGPGTTPSIQISIDGASSGDYWTFDYKTLDGFKVRFYDKNNVAVSRQFDVAAKGYGRKAPAVI